MQKKITATIKIVLLALILAGGVSYINAANITAPTCAPPGCNAAAPVNVSIADQTKSGPLTLSQNAFINGMAPNGIDPVQQGLSIANGRLAVGTLLTPISLKAVVMGNVGASAYCDVNGNNCATPPLMSASSSGATGSIPSGAVMAFDLSACPSGWTSYTTAAGRNIVGVGGSYTLRETGGAATHTLTVNQIPAHNHRYKYVEEHEERVQDGGNGADGDVADNPEDTPDSVRRYTENTGGGQAHNIMDPYIALLYCKKN